MVAQVKQCRVLKLAEPAVTCCDWSCLHAIQAYGAEDSGTSNRFARSVQGGLCGKACLAKIGSYTVLASLTATDTGAG